MSTIGISQNVCAKMFKRVRLYSGNPEIAREIGYESVTYRSFCYIENIFMINDKKNLSTSSYLISSYNSFTLHSKNPGVRGCKNIFNLTLFNLRGYGIGTNNIKERLQ